MHAAQEWMRSGHLNSSTFQPFKFEIYALAMTPPWNNSVAVSEQEKTPGMPRYWIVVLIIILIFLLLVPVLSIGLSIQKAGWVPVARKPTNKASQKEQPRGESPEDALVRERSASLRERVEKIAATAIKLPKLQPKIQQVRIEAPQPSMKKASDSVHRVLDARNQQYVEAVENDRIRIIVIVPGKDWPKLSGSLQMAAEKDGFIYQGPRQTASVNGTESMVAEIEILRKPGSGAKKGK
jgi:hypothetical protein